MQLFCRINERCNRMKKWKKILAPLLAAAMVFSAAPFSFAAVEDTGFSDVSAGSWYADAVEYVSDNGLMSGTGDAVFSPDMSTSRAMMAALLYRASGSPDVSASSSFTDVPADAWYADAVSWASENDFVSGYGDGTYGPEDLVSREQIAAILWRYAGSPQADPGSDFSDESDISAYASAAVDWARANSIINGLENNRFDPQGDATRAQIAVLLMNYLTAQQGGEETPDETAGNALVVYFSATGNTQRAAESIAEAAGADLYEIVPEEPYTSADLDWNDPDSRVSREHEDPSLRPAIGGEALNPENYDTVFLGYPIWWGEAPNIIRTFLEENDLSGKTIIPFCTSSSSGIGSSAENLQTLAPDAEWLAGQRFSGSTDPADIAAWVESLGILS